MNKNKLTGKSIRVALALPYASAEIVEFLFRPDVITYWIGVKCLIIPILNSDAILPDENGKLVNGKVIYLSWPNKHSGAVNDLNLSSTQFSFELHVAFGEILSKPRVIFRISPRADGSSRLRIECFGLKNEEGQSDCLEIWQHALRRVNRIIHKIRLNHNRERQALIIVHGIGEQRPSQFLREFIENIFDSEAGEIHFVKPDYISSLFDLQMASVPRSKNDPTRPTTDVYELYWAHLIRDTSLTQIFSWMCKLIFSDFSKKPVALIRLVRFSRLLFIISIIIIIICVWLLNTDFAGWLKGVGGGALIALSVIITTAFRALRDEFFIGYAGDAARYLDPKPANVARRQEIREAGVKLLDTLHDRGRYSRVIVYGHSLGSVIAYDILRYAWAQLSRRRVPIKKTSSRALRALEDQLNPRHNLYKSAQDPFLHAGAVNVVELQAMQHAAWLEYRRNGFIWRVSDFVTAGSPLAHADWLLNLDSTTGFSNLTLERSFPTCPPQTEIISSPKPGVSRRVFTFTHAYQDKNNPLRKRSVQIPHYGGLFALTRWTNLYFPHTNLIDGDPIAGPLAPSFGRWIMDIKLDDTKGFAHCRYTNKSLEPEAVLKLRSALKMGFRRPLYDYINGTLSPTVTR